MMTEKQLIDGCIANDRIAQRELYERYKNAMFTLAYRITNDFELANDVLQEGFVQVFRAMTQFRGDATLGAWIKIDNLPADSLVQWGNSLDSEYLEKAIQSLPEGYRTVFLLIEVEGYPHKEVAEMLGISEGTSKSQLFYAKKRLREMLKEYV
jgi:DNA-directed RNA polymerase specialized sigma24 family protein